jgi:WD40 repeat protein
MKRAFLFLAVAMLYCNTTLAQEPDPDPNLLWKTENGYDRFLVHPNGNILAGKYSTEVELDGNTGLIIREFPYPAVFYDISPDGKYISALTDQRCVIDYETQEVIARFTNENTFPQFMPDSKTLIYFLNEPIGELNGNLKLVSYNFETKQGKSSANFIQNTRAGIISVSPDGRFVATGCIYFDASENEYTRLILWDAQTLEPIKVLGKIDDFNEVRSIKFSTDSKLVGFQVYLSNLYIYKTDDYSLFKHYNNDNILNGVMGFGFIANDFIAVGSDENNVQNFEIINLKDEKSIYKRNDFTGLSEYNISHNTLIVLRGNIYCFDFEKILTGASITPKILNPFTVEYITNTLFIKNHNFSSVQLSAQITDINGRIIRNIDLNSTTGEIRISIKLLSGTYFLHIKDGDKEYVSKFLVTN